MRLIGIPAGKSEIGSPPSQSRPNLVLVGSHSEQARDAAAAVGDRIRIRATITIDAAASDALAAIEYQRVVLAAFDRISSKYPDAMLSFDERRPRLAACNPRDEQPVKEPTGRLNVYED